MELLNAKNKQVIEMYKGGVKVWELPTVMTDDINLQAGSNELSFTTYPEGCKVVVTINSREIANEETVFGGYFSCSIDPPLKNGDYVIIEITKSGWRGLKKTYPIF